MFSMKSPEPIWKPSTVEAVEMVAAKMLEYTDRKRAFVVFSFGTVVFSDTRFARSDIDYCQTLLSAVQRPPDFRVILMNDRNLLVRFAGPVSGIVLNEFYLANKMAITSGVESGGLLPGETLVAPAETSVLLDHYIAGLYARAKLYSDVGTNRIASRIEP